MRKAEREDFDRMVLAYFRPGKKPRILNTNQVARHFNRKWETADRSIRRLVSIGKLYYYPEMGDNPCFYGTVPDPNGTHRRTQHDGSHPDETTNAGERESDAISVPVEAQWVRAEVPGDYQEIPGFVCHPSTRKLQAPELVFVRSHLHGHYSVKVTKMGRRPESFKITDPVLAVGEWTVKEMRKGANYNISGRIRIPDRDPLPYTVQGLTDKEGMIHWLQIRPHHRYIYYKSVVSTSMTEFEHQAREVMEILSLFGWEFGELEQRGPISTGDNCNKIACQVKRTHHESDTDTVHFDSSVGGDGEYCTEAEIIHDHEGSEEEQEILSELPQRIKGLTASADEQSKRIEAMNCKMDQMISVAEKGIQLDELLLSMSVSNTESRVPKDDRTPPVGASHYRGDVMYG